MWQQRTSHYTGRVNDRTYWIPFEIFIITWSRWTPTSIISKTTGKYAASSFNRRITYWNPTRRHSLLSTESSAHKASLASVLRSRNKDLQRRLPTRLMNRKWEVIKAWSTSSHRRAYCWHVRSTRSLEVDEPDLSSLSRGEKTQPTNAMMTIQRL